MKTLNYGLGILCLSLGACGASVENAVKKGIEEMPTPVKPATFNAMSGAWTGEAQTRRGGEASTCTVALTVNESATEYKIDKLTLACPDGSEIAMDPMTFALQAPANVQQQAHDVAIDGTVVGWLNYTHDAFYVVMKKDNVDLTIHITQNKDGLTLEQLQGLMNGQEMFGTDSAALHSVAATALAGLGARMMCSDPYVR